MDRLQQSSLQTTGLYLFVRNVIIFKCMFENKHFGGEEYKAQFNIDSISDKGSLNYSSKMLGVTDALKHRSDVLVQVIKFYQSKCNFS